MGTPLTFTFDEFKAFTFSNLSSSGYRFTHGHGENIKGVPCITHIVYNSEFFHNFSLYNVLVSHAGPLT